MHIGDALLEQVRDDGYALMERFLTTEEVDRARAALFEIYPTPDDYFADPEQHVELTSHPFAGVRVGPYGKWDLDRIAFHPDLVDAAERFCGSTDLELYKIEVWAKYSGAIDYDQPHHRDFGNHSLVVPRRDGRWPQLTTFILLSDVTEEDGPTKVIPRSVGDEVPLFPNPNRDPALREHEVSITGPAGSIFMYHTDVLHRGSDLTGHRRSRFMMLADYQARGNPWMGKVSWPGKANQPVWEELLARATPRQRDLFGFPPPGHEYWNDQTLRDVAGRWPGIDLTPYRPG